MAIFKVTLVFKYDGVGWTESYALNLNQPTTPQSVYALYALAVANARINLLGGGAFLDYIRISTIGTPFSVFTQKDGRQGGYGVASLPADNGVLIRCYPQNPGPVKSLFLRGIPGSIVTGDQYTPPANWTRALQNFFGVLVPPTVSLWGWYGVNEASKLQSPVTGYTVIAGSNRVQVTTALPIFPAGLVNKKTTVTFTAINGKSELNGKQVVLVNSTTEVTTKDAFGVIAYQGGGTATFQTNQFIPFFSLVDEKLTNRKAGKQLFLPPGRARAKVRT
jgi:hypothetical protein